MVFRLSRLGRDTIDQARSAATTALGKASTGSKDLRRWNLLADLQIGLDWAFASVLANLFLMLLMVGLVILALGLASQKDHAHVVRIVLAIALPTLALLWVGYRFLASAPQRVFALLAAAAVGSRCSPPRRCSSCTASRPIRKRTTSRRGCAPACARWSACWS
jgi:hypothetical protein